MASKALSKNCCEVGAPKEVLERLYPVGYYFLMGTDHSADIESIVAKANMNSGIDSRRICFNWDEGEVSNVEIVDYHG